MQHATDDYATGTGCPQAGATTGSRPTEREGDLYRMASALEFSPLRNENSGGPNTTEPTNKSGALADAALLRG